MINKFYKFIKKERLNLGICMLSLAISLSNLISFIFYKDYSILSNIFLIIGVLLVIDYKNVLKGSIIINFNRFILLFFVIYFTVLSFKNVEEFSGTSYSIIYNLFSIVVVCAIITRNEWKNKENFVKILFYFTGFLSILLYLVIRYNLANSLLGISSIYDVNGKAIADRLSLTTIPLYSIISSICYKTDNKKEKILKILFVIIAIFAYLPLHRRGPTLEVLLFIIILLLRNMKLKNKISKKSIKAFLITVVSIIIIYVILSTNNEYVTRINNLCESIIKALRTLFSGKSNQSGIDPSAIVRYNNRQYIINEWGNYSIIDLFIGKGYMYKYLDFPLFQAFIDMGLFGGILYLINTILNYINRILKNTNTDLDKFLLFIAISSLLKCFYSGIPYSWTIYYTISILLLKQIDDNKKEKYKK